MPDLFDHPALNFTNRKPLVYTAMSKHLFYFRQHISKYVLETGAVPLNPFTSFEYFMLDTVNRDIIREANNTFVQKADELWSFGPVSDGMLAEIKIAKSTNKPIKYFSLVNSSYLTEVPKEEVIFEKDLEQFRNEL